MRILVVEDDPHLSKVLKIALETQGYLIDLYTDGEDGYQAGLNNTYDAMVLDVTLPSKSGLEICKSLRQNNITAPIIMLTGLNDQKHKVAGLDHGADDYLTKPFSNEEFYARIRALLRRKTSSRSPVIELGSLKLDTNKRELRRGDKVIELMPKEYSLLEYMMFNQDKALTRQELFKHIWGIDAQNTSNRLDVYVRYAREKLAAAGEPDVIQTMRGVGYKLSAPD